MAKKEIEPAGPQSDVAKRVQEQRAEQRRKDIEQANKDKGKDGL